MDILIVINDPPYGTERRYNALRLANALRKRDAETGVTVFLIADAIVAARRGQKTPEGFCNIELMLQRLIAGQATILLCGTCMDARGMTDEDMIAGASRSNIDALAAATASANKVLAF